VAEQNQPGGADEGASDGASLDPLTRLAAGVAHEINTPVQYVSDNLRFLNDAFADVTDLIDRWRDVCNAAQRGPIPPALMAEAEEALRMVDVDQLREEIPKAVDRALEGLVRVAEVARRVRAQAHSVVPAKTKIDLGTLLETIVTHARVEHIQIADFELSVAPGLPPLASIDNDLQQAFQRLIERAAHAIADVVDKRGARGHIRVAADLSRERVRIMVEDDGLGIPPERCQTMFQARGGDGSENALALVDQVVRGRLGGRILFESGVGHGTRFHLLIPAETPSECLAGTPA